MPNGYLRRSASWGLALAAALAAATVPVTSSAQSQVGPRPTELKEIDGTSTPLVRPTTGFKLFAEEDFGASGLKHTGSRGTYVSNRGPCPYYWLGNRGWWFCESQTDQSGAVQNPYFNIDMIAVAGPHDFRKIRTVHPGINNMAPPLGYSALFTRYLVPPNVERFAPADGQFGTVFAGVTATNGDGSCRDHSGFGSGYVEPGFTLLAGSDCPETWGSRGWQGPRPVIEAERLAAFQAGPNGFSFNDWQLPASAFDTTQFLGNFSTYGYIADFNRELLQRYGSVTKLGAGAPSERGFPLGLEMKLEAFQLSRPSIRNTSFVYLTIVNRSDKIYGTGVDYDSLYFGLMPGMLYANNTAGTQGASMYADVKRNTLIVARGNYSGKCSTTFPRRLPGATGCQTTDGPVQEGTSIPNVIMGITFLKSPLGDERNKLLSDSTSPYYAPTSPFADDTITFNRNMRNSFGLSINNLRRSERATYGMVAAKPEDYLDGRTEIGTNATTWQLFQYEGYDGTNGPQSHKFNRFVPGSTPGYGKWDYDNDGLQDEIVSPSCGVAGCVTPFADSIAGGFNNFAGNLGNVIAAGPFKLGAGDTTQFIWAFTGAQDSASFEALLNNTLRAYKGNYAGPRAFPAPVITDADVQVTSALVRQARGDELTQQRVEVRINIKQLPASVRKDPFIASVAALINENSPAANSLRANNPGLLAAVQQRIDANLADLLVFKSCDNGATFTVTNDCRAAQTLNLDGTAIGLGWQPYQVIKGNQTNGEFGSSVFVDLVRPGRTYLYSFVTRTRGLADLPVIIQDPVTGVRSTGTLSQALSVDIDTIYSPLATTGPSTATVYAPISIPQGTRLAEVIATPIFGQATRTILPEPAGTVRGGTYRVVFGNRFVIRTVLDTVSNEATQTVYIQRVISNAVTPTGATQANFIATNDSIVGSRGLVVVDSLTVPSNRISTSGRTVTYEDVINSTAGQLGFALVSDSVGQQKAYFISRNGGTAGFNLGQFFASPDFPGFVPVFEALNRVGTGANITTTPRISVTIDTRRDTLNQVVVNANAVTYQTTNSNAQSINRGPGGRYLVNWRDDAYGPNAPFRYTTAEQIRSDIRASLVDREVADVGDTAAVRAVIGGTRRLLPVKVPFTITTPSGSEAIVAMFARHSSAADSAALNTILVGTGNDTVRVPIPVDVWVPGDSLIVLEVARVDSTVGAGATAAVVLKDTTIGGRTRSIPVQKLDTLLAFQPLVLGCTSNSTPSRLSCNPLALTVNGIANRGATGYLPYENGYTQLLDFPRNFGLFDEVRLQANATTFTADAGERRKIKVVPNPYIVQSDYDAIDANRNGTARLYFTNVPEAGTIRIYSVAGQFLQQLAWTRADLENYSQGALSGDLPWNLRSREGLDLGSGLYLFVVTPSAGRGETTRGKFVVIR